MAADTPRSLELAPIAADPTAIPDPDRPHPAGLTWVEPLTPRPIALGPSADHPDVRPALALDAGRFWTMSRHGLEIGRREIAMDQAVARQALAANPRQGHLRIAVAEAADAWSQATTHAAADLIGATL